MFTTPAPAAPTLSTTTSPASPTSPSRPGRLRGLSYLRNYTHAHLHSHTHSNTAGGTLRPSAGRSQSSPSPTSSTTDSFLRSSSRQGQPSPVAQYSESTENSSSSASGRSGLSRLLSSQESSNVNNDPDNSSSTMTRNRSETAGPHLSVRQQSGPTPTNMDGSESQTENGAPKQLPSIRFIPHQDPRAARPSLIFPTITRTLPDENSVIRVGRYSERDNIPDVPPNVPSAAAVGFKSKVVSRKHCEFWCSDSQWYVKDVKSSSGTFLNHIRLSQPNVESKPFKIKDGDIIQLGIDFRGGEEMIFRCVKIRVECNRGWQQGLNNFNKQTHQRLRNLAKAKKESDSASTHTSECSICLMSIAPCQSLFVAPCSHVWHYKCIRPILIGPTWPNFLCPNCRAVADLEADVEELNDFEEWDEDLVEGNGNADGPNGEANGEDGRQLTPKASQLPIINPVPTAGSQTPNARVNLADLESVLSSMTIHDAVNGGAARAVLNPSTPQHEQSPPASSSVTQPVTIGSLGLSAARTTSSDALSPGEHAPECPMTPRNDAGPFVLDGSAGRASTGRPSVDEASPSGGVHLI